MHNDLIAYHPNPENVRLAADTVLGTCPSCNTAPVVLSGPGVGQCFGCEIEFTVELVVRLAQKR